MGAHKSYCVNDKATKMASGICSTAALTQGCRARVASKSWIDAQHNAGAELKGKNF